VGLLSGLVLGARARRAVHRLTLALLVGALAIQVLRRGTGLDGVALAAIAVLAAAVALVVARTDVARLWLRVASPAPAVFAGLFLFGSSVSPLVSADAASIRAVEGAARAVPVVVIVLDELPTATLLDGSGAIDAARFPNLAALAADSVFFRNHTAVGEYTQIAMTAALTGRYPPHGVTTPSWAAHPDTLFRLLGGSHRVHAFESLTALCPPTVCDGSRDDARAAVSGSRSRGVRPVLGEAIDLYGELVALHDPPAAPDAGLAERFEVAAAPDPDTPGPTLPSDADPDARARAEPVRLRAFLDALGAGAPGEPPGLWFLHLVLPHHPYRLFADGQAYALPEYSRQMPGLQANWVWVDDPWPALAARQRHVLQTRYVDTALGEVVARLESEGLYDDALVVVTADHGASFVPGASYRAPDDRTVPGVAWVPLLVKLPGSARTGVDDRNVEQVDLLATIADALDVEIPWRTDGVSAFAHPPRAAATKTFVRSPSLVSDDGYATLSLDARAGFASMLALAALTSGRDDPELDVFASVPHGDLIGRRVDVLPRAARIDVRAVVDDAEAFDDVDADGVVPAFVRGHLDGAPSGGATVVLSLGGRIVGVSATFAYEGEPSVFTALLPADSFRDGRNDLDVLLLVARSGGLALAPVDRAG
jgi:hypothetical protein